MTAWPEIVTPAYFVSRGLLLYDAIFFPHTPLLILTTALFGKLFGFSAALFRALIGLSMAATGALVVHGTRPHRRSLAGPAVGFIVAAPLAVLWTAYTEGPALWPEPFVGPILLLATLLLERHERRGSRGDMVASGLLLGSAILVKQTSAWAALAAIVWFAFRSRRRGAATIASLAGSVVAPYAAFALVWGGLFRTAAHLRWTLFTPLFGGLGREIAAPPGAPELHEAVVLFLPLLALPLCSWSLPAFHRWRSPLVLVAIGAAGMAWPRWGLLHLGGLAGFAAIASARALLALAASLKRMRKRSARPLRLAATTAGAALTVVPLAVALVGAGSLLAGRLGGPVFYWDDAVTRELAAQVRRRRAPGDELLVYEVSRESLYAITGTQFPGRLYVNPSFWYCLDREGVDSRVVAVLAARPGLPVLFCEPPIVETRLRATAVYRFLSTRTHILERLDARTTWRAVD